jgi:hypothetical protein
MTCARHTWQSNRDFLRQHDLVQVQRVLLSPLQRTPPSVPNLGRILPVVTLESVSTARDRILSTLARVGRRSLRCT